MAFGVAIDEFYGIPVPLEVGARQERALRPLAGPEADCPQIGRALQQGGQKGWSKPRPGSAIAGINGPNLGWAGTRRFRPTPGGQLLTGVRQVLRGKAATGPAGELTAVEDRGECQVVATVDTCIERDRDDTVVIAD